MFSFFLGANSGHGFHSFYDELIDLKKAKAVYILKGGPGSGKSSVMRTVAGEAKRRGIPFEQIFCSSDPSSLDGIVLPTLGAAVVDGTSPHVVEPSFPLAVEEYINLSDFADIPAIKTKRDGIIKTKERYGEFFPHVYRMTACAEKVDDELFDIALGGVSIQKLFKRSDGIISREIRGKGDGFSQKKRFCEAISPEMYKSVLPDNLNDFTRIYTLFDTFGLSHFLLTRILDACKTHKYACITCHSPLKPTQIRHLLIPELSLAFITSDDLAPQGAESLRNLHIDAMVKKDYLKQNKRKTATLKRLRLHFINEACNTLKDAKLVHDELEELYNPHINFEGLYSFAEDLSKKIFRQ